ncbi:MAG: ExbD/TolR family protein [Bacteroidota bacterium]
MALRTRNKISVAFSMSSMTDIVFLLLIFFMLTSTLIAPNALKLLLPQSNSQTAAKPITTVSITADLQYYIEQEPVDLSELENVLLQKLQYEQEPTISLHVDKSVAVEHMVKVMNIAKNNNIKMILATQPIR